MNIGPVQPWKTCDFVCPQPPQVHMPFTYSLNYFFYFSFSLEKLKTCSIANDKHILSLSRFLSADSNDQKNTKYQMKIGQTDYIFL